MKIWLRVLGMLTVALLIVPALFVVYRVLFPIFYFMVLVIFFKSDDDAFFYGYWVIAFLLTIFLSRFLIKVFERWKTSMVFLPSVAAVIFTIFAINVFPYYGRFPDVTVANLINRDKREVASAIAHANNGHPAPPFYAVDKRRVEQAFRKYNEPFAALIKLKLALSKSPFRSKSEQPVVNDTLDFDLYRLLIGLPDEVVTNIIVDTIVYDKSFRMLFVMTISTNDLNRYAGKIFIGNRQLGDSALIKLFPYEPALFPVQDSKEVLILSMRKTHFTDAYGFKSPLDSVFWKAPLFTENAEVDTSYLMNRVWAGHRSSCPFILVP
ncbi:MAG: hypothetical protein JNM41_03965 [Flavipsychrobacter sp.]|nr:hypothetical protein [Flavipsychrobacter sp.]